MTAERTRSVAGEDAVRKDWSPRGDIDSTTNAACSNVSNRSSMPTCQQNAPQTVLLVKAQFEKLGVPAWT
jgi:hypothetical protein